MATIPSITFNLAMSLIETDIRAEYNKNRDYGSIPDSAASEGWGKGRLQSIATKFIRKYYNYASAQGYSFTEKALTDKVNEALANASGGSWRARVITAKYDCRKNVNIPDSAAYDKATDYNYNALLVHWLCDNFLFKINTNAILATYTKQNDGTNDTGDNGASNESNATKIDDAINSITSETADPLTEAEEQVLDETYNRYASADQDIRNSKISLLRSVFGMPYQFLPDTDRRSIYDPKNGSSSDYSFDAIGSNSVEYMGRKYVERISTRANILFITPGKVTFLKSASENLKSSIFTQLVGAGGEFSDIKNALLKDNDSFKYYSFDFDPITYWYYLNPMIRAAARYLNLPKVALDGNGEQDLTQVNYYKLFAKAGGMENTFFTNAFGALTFYLDSTNTASDSITTSLGTSALVDQYIKQPTAIAQEVSFLAGKAVHDLTRVGWVQDLLDNAADKEAASDSLQKVHDFVKTYLNNNALANKLAMGVATVATGGQIIFPKIWNDTNFESDSISCTLKLVSPDTDDFSIWWNILIPTYAVLCLAAPHGNPGIDGYSQPFPVKAFCQSMFNIECGFITSLSIRRGGEGLWTRSGLPTALDIDITITDVYDSRYISKGHKEAEFSLNPFKLIGKTLQKTPFLKNTTMMNWIACSCGININKPDVLRDIDIYIGQAIINPIIDPFKNILVGIQTKLKNFCPVTVDILSVFR